jgi:bifunctional DNA-binding transcriptional regulator/antitoxin component of YhaV-PrlF toxin-antitoxin module
MASKPSTRSAKRRVTYPKKKRAPAGLASLAGGWKGSEEFVKALGKIRRTPPRSLTVRERSSKYQLVLPRGARERLKLKPGMRITVIEKGGVMFLVPERPVGAYRGIVRGLRVKGLREKTDRRCIRSESFRSRREGC